MEYMQEKEIFRYVLATLDGTYLKSLHMGSYCFSDIESCTKFASEKLAEQYIKYYRHDTRDNTTDLFVIPVRISYDLINEKWRVRI